MYGIGQGLGKAVAGVQQYGIGSNPVRRDRDLEGTAEVPALDIDRQAGWVRAGGNDLPLCAGGLGDLEYIGLCEPQVGIRYSFRIFKAGQHFVVMERVLHDEGGAPAGLDGRVGCHHSHGTGGCGA